MSDGTPIPPTVGVNVTTFTDDPTGWLLLQALSLVEFAARNPKEFLVTFFLILSPLMAICGYLSYLMIKDIESKEKKEKQKALRANAANKAKKKATKTD